MLRKFTGKYFSVLNVNLRFEFSIDGVEVWPPVLAVKNTDDNSKEATQFRHSRLIIT